MDKDKREIIRTEIDDTISDITDKIGRLETQMSNAMKSKLGPIYEIGKHPWLILGGAVAAGAVVGTFLVKRHRRDVDGSMDDYEAFSGYRPGETSEEEEIVGRMKPAVSRTMASGPKEPSFISELANEFSDEIRTLRRLALGMLLEKTAQQVKKSFPEISTKVEEVVESAHSKLGFESPSGSATSRIRRAVPTL